MNVRPRRSVLYVPAANARALAKARGLDADALILDLEDAVAPEAKVGARAAACAALAEGGFGHRETVIRVNGLDTPWGEDDLAAAAVSAPDAVLLPKVSGPDAVMRAAAALTRAGAPATTRLWAMVETPAALLGLAGIAAVAVDPAARLAALVLGTNDLAAELRLRPGPGRAPLLPWLAATVAAGRLHGLDVLDGVFNGLDDPEGLAAEARQGRDFGCDGKTCIHPGQIAACNAAFAPDAAEVAWARRITAAFAAPDGARANVLRIDGRMVERLHADAAGRVLALAAAVAGRPEASAGRASGGPPAAL